MDEAIIHCDKEIHMRNAHFVKSAFLQFLLAAFVFMTSGAEAASNCVSPQDANALRAAALQQQLMVSAFTCRKANSFNQFVLAYESDLRISDATLLRFFQSRNPVSGLADYDTYKTELANGWAMRSGQDQNAFCDAAGALFVAALGSGEQSLVGLVSSLPARDGEPFAVCKAEHSTMAASASTSNDESSIPVGSAQIASTNDPHVKALAR